MDNNELQHHGIPGMKWGIRRYQNKDGTLTNAGKKRYEKELAKAKEEAKLIKNRERTQAKLDKLSALKSDNASRKAALDQRKAEEKPVKEPKHKDKPHKMTDEELQAKIDRMNLENKYKELMAAENPPKSRKGKEFVTKALDQTVESLLPQVGKYFGAKLINKVIGEEAVYANNKKKS